MVNGLAWTEAGGEILEVEVNVMEGSGKLELTGNLGDVMKESAQAALSCLRSRAAALGIDPDFYKTKDIHVHFPEGAVPKDGPSAGIAMTTAHAVRPDRHARSRRDIAMTGEVTLRGRVLPIGGLKEKTMAAIAQRHPHGDYPRGQRAGPGGDRPDRPRRRCALSPVETVDQVFAEAFCAWQSEPDGKKLTRSMLAPLPTAGRTVTTQLAAVEGGHDGTEFQQGGVCALRRESARISCGTACLSLPSRAAPTWENPR